LQIEEEKPQGKQQSKVELVRMSKSIPPLLLIDFYELAMAQSYFNYRPGAFATFDLFVRRLPENRSFLLFCGLQEVIDYLGNLEFSKQDISFLKSLRRFSDDFLHYLKKFRFTGDMWTMEEGEIFFASEPVIRITAPLIQAQIIESFLLNTINLSTMIATKAARIVNIAQGRGLYDFSLRRTHGQDASIKVARSSFIAGFKGTSNVLAGKTYGIPVVGTMAHSFVMSFNSELQSFRAFADTFPKGTILLIDTYDSIEGINRAIVIANELKKKGHTLKGIRLDSGNIISLSKIARRMLDRARLHKVKIFASGNLDEYKIDRFVKAHAPIDDFGVGTHMGTSCDAPYLDVIYKISEVTDAYGKFLPTMKLSKRKATLPGRKQVFRISNKTTFKHDVVGLAHERIKNAKPLLRPIIQRGKMVYSRPSILEIKKRATENLSRLSHSHKCLKGRCGYDVKISPSLQSLAKKLPLAINK